jgi:[acyl-carrier-protein] S-malonyltransferase
VINSVDGTPYDAAEMISGQLQRQVYSPVRWVDTVNRMLGDGATSLIECGPGKVLAGLNKRISRTTPIGYIDTPESMNKALELAQGAD